MQIFRALDAPPTDPRASGGCGLCPKIVKWRNVFQASAGLHMYIVKYIACLHVHFWEPVLGSSA